MRERPALTFAAQGPSAPEAGRSRFLPAPAGTIRRRVRSEATTTCPVCGEDLVVAVDPITEEGGEEEYVQDCSVCCRPIVVRVRLEADGDVSIEAWSE